MVARFLTAAWQSLLLMTLVSMAACKTMPTATQESAPADGDKPEDLLNHGCYAPINGPVPKDRRIAWIQKIYAHCQEAERTYGVPAAGICAMTTNEGGYGETRTAVHANNVFGYKWVSSKDAEGRGAYTLTCQPASDPGNKYIKFRDMRDGILFVAKKLATVDRSWSSWKKITDRYIKDRQNGVNVQEAVDRWISGIADEKYNYDPKTYKATITKHARDYVSVSWTRHSQYNTYQYSETIMPKKPGGGGIASSTNTSGTGSANTDGAGYEITAPWWGQTVKGVFHIKTQVPAGIAYVEFYARKTGSQNWGKIGTDYSAPFSINWTTTSLANGTYDLLIKGFNGSQHQQGIKYGQAKIQN